ncbi:MAG: hypothetical protein WAK96_11915 [Desulfobaccales bacterium]
MRRLIFCLFLKKIYLFFKSLVCKMWGGASHNPEKVGWALPTNSLKNAHLPEIQNAGRHFFLYGGYLSKKEIICKSEISGNIKEHHRRGPERVSVHPGRLGFIA